MWVQENENFIMKLTAVNSIAYNASKILVFNCVRPQILSAMQESRQQNAGLYKQKFLLKYKDIILPLYISSVRSHMDYAVQFWSPHHTKDIAKLEDVQRMATKMITSLRNISYEERLASVNLLSLEKHQLRGKLNECFKVYKDFTNVKRSKLFSIDNTLRTRSNGVKLRCKQIQQDNTKFLFTNDVVREWNNLPPSVVQCDTINSLKNKT